MPRKGKFVMAQDGGDQVMHLTQHTFRAFVRTRKTAAWLVKNHYVANMSAIVVLHLDY